ncbi:MAG: GNAT family N-acetyltransferase [bacterium]|nr:GNAT family N-acetyltransferase [bacterium]
MEPYSVTTRTAGIDDLYPLAEVMWFARKAAYANGSLPRQDLNLRRHENPATASDWIGIIRAAEALRPNLMGQGLLPEDSSPLTGGYLILAAEANHQVVGKFGINFRPQLRRVGFMGVDVRPEYQGIGIATELRAAAIHLAYKHMPDVQEVRFGRYRKSDIYAAKHLPNSFFERLRRQAVLIEPSVSGTIKTAFYTVPIETYIKELHRD